MLEKRGLNRNNQYQKIDDIFIYPQEYFSPYNYAWEYSEKTDKTICEHLFYVSWIPWHGRIKKMVKKLLTRSIKIWKK